MYDFSMGVHRLLNSGWRGFLSARAVMTSLTAWGATVTTQRLKVAFFADPDDIERLHRVHGPLERQQSHGLPRHLALLESGLKCHAGVGPPEVDDTNVVGEEEAAGAWGVNRWGPSSVAELPPRAGR
jgi:hypothetical protein